MSSTPVDEIEESDLYHEAKQALQDIAYLTRRYRAIYRRMNPHSHPDGALMTIAVMVARIDLDAPDAGGSGND